MRQVRIAIRTFGRSPIFSGTVLLSLAVGGAVLFAALSLLAAGFLKTSPYPSADRIVEIWPTESPKSSVPADYVQAERLRVWMSEEMRSLASLAGTGLGTSLVWRRPEGPVRVETRPVLGDWFGVHAVPAERGRALGLDDDRAGAAPAAVLSRSFAERYYPGIDPLAVTMQLDDRVYTVVGVMPSRFESDEVVWIPAVSMDEASRPVAYLVRGRLADGASMSEAETEVRTLAHIQVTVDSARWHGRGATVSAVGGVIEKVNVEVLTLVIAMIGAVLVVGMINLITVFQLRADGLRSDIAIRSALGASLRALVLMRTREGLVLGLIGAALGLLLGQWLVRILSSTVPGVALEIAGQHAFAVAVPTALGVVLAPVLMSLCTLRRTSGEGLAGAMRGRIDRPGHERLGKRRVMLVATQVAVTVVLTTAMFAMVAAHNAFSRIPVGYDADDIIQAKMDFEVGRVASEYQWSTVEGVVNRLTRLPSVARLAMWRFVMQDYPPTEATTPVIEGVEGVLPPAVRLYSYYEVWPGSLDALGIQMIVGRSFAEAEASDGLQAVVTRSGAIAWWGDGRAALGKWIRLTRDSPALTVVGVAEDVLRLGDMGRHFGASGRVLPFLFVRADQVRTIPTGWRAENCISCVGVTIGVRPSASHQDVPAALRAELGNLLPGVPITSIGTIADQQATTGYGADIVRARALLLLALGIGLLLATVGVAGTVAQNAVQRRREIGIRAALGAPSASIIFVVVREAALAAGAGIGAGIAIVLLGKEALERLFFAYAIQQMRIDVFTLPLTAAASIGILALVVVAALWPTRRALRVDPAVVLRDEV